VCIYRPLEKEEPRCAGVKGNRDSDQHALTRGKHPARRTEGNAARYVCERGPVQITLIARTGDYASETDKGALSLAIKVPDNAHR